MMRKIGAIGILVGVLVSSAFAQSSSSVSLKQVADKVEKNGKTVSYAAVRRITIRSASSPRTFDEQILRAKGMIYLSYPKDSPYEDQQIYERDGKRYTYTKSNNELRIAPSRSGSAETVELLRKSESVEDVILKRGEAVANRPTIYIEIPSSRSRGGSHRLWIDRDKYVVLKRTFGASATDEVGGFEISRIDYTAKISISKFSWPRGAKVISVFDDLKRLAKQMKLQPVTWKNSEKMELVSVGQMEFRDKQILRQFYTDGENRLSLFVMKETDDPIEFKPGRVKIYRWNSGGMTLFLIGDYSESELQRMSRSVKT